MKKKKIIILTTKALHHFFFINEISKIADLYVVFENNSLKPNFKTKHNYEKEQYLYEKKKWFDNKKTQIIKKLNSINVNDINDKKVTDFISTNKPDIIFSFGISKLKKNFQSAINKKIYNFHGGDTSFYRGLDSHLWSLYHNDIRGLKVTLHEVNDKLDTGRTVFKEKLELKQTNKLYQLRSINTQICIKLAKKFIKNGKIKKLKLSKIGRYYSFMPTQIKNVINKKYKLKLNKIYNDS
jgi:methionyl-tRNA formyltransferase